MEILQPCYNRHGLQNKNWILAGLRNIKTCHFCCSDCRSQWFRPCLNTYISFDCSIALLCIGIVARQNPPVILIDCVRTIWIVKDCETLRNRDCNGLPHDMVDCNGISTDYRPTIGSAIQNIALQSTKSGRNRNLGIIGKREDCGVFGDEILVIFSADTYERSPNH